eukprot:gnl/Dysnectes_brevis/56_a71_13994.p1 GENE.gnl/Dysnectes_brevis/56_a71_13994~~gnl/Dysnectes_brevis/56_a71_13994.p1  ORF type:complete len:217 (-),score=60.01 gnl/Dysnectes_brevis/56_a71_13994:105-755(-)
MSRINAELLGEKIAAMMTASVEKGRKFTETVELQIGLKGYDPRKDRRFNVPLVLPNNPRPNLKICIIGDAFHCDMASELGLEHTDLDALKSFNKDKTLVKRFAGKYDAFLASKTVIRRIHRVLGPGLNRAGKAPISIDRDCDLLAKVQECQATIRVQFKKTIGLNFPVGHMKMTPEQIQANITLTLNFLASQLKKNWQSIRVVYIKTTMGPSFRVF